MAHLSAMRLQFAFIFLFLSSPLASAQQEPPEPNRRPPNIGLCSVKNNFVVGNNPSAIWVARNLPKSFAEISDKAKADAILEVSMYVVFGRTGAPLRADFTNSISMTLASPSGEIIWREYDLGEYWRISSLHLIDLMEKDLLSLHCEKRELARHNVPLKSPPRP